MLISFCLPTSILSKKRRENILLILDATGKFNFLNSYIMVITLVAFHLHVEFPVIAQSKAEKGSIIDLFTYEVYGHVTLIIGTFISMILSHIMTHLNRNLEDHPDQNRGAKAESYKSIMSFAKTKCINNTIFRIFISSMLFITFGLFITGLIIESFSFCFQGLVGYGINLLGYPQQRRFSIIRLGLNGREVYENPLASEIIFIQIFYFLTILAIPIAFLVNLIILWFVPMTRKNQKIFYSIGEILNAWSSIDVFVIALLSGVSQIGLFAKFLVGDKCDDINPIIKKYFSKILEGHDTCFEVEADLSGGIWLFLAAAVSLFIISFVILKECRNALNERLPDNVKEYLKMKEIRYTLTLKSLDSEKILKENDNI